MIKLRFIQADVLHVARSGMDWCQYELQTRIRTPAIEAKSLGENDLPTGDMQVQLSASKAASGIPHRSNALGVKKL